MSDLSGIQGRQKEISTKFEDQELAKSVSRLQTKRTGRIQEENPVTDHRASVRPVFGRRKSEGTTRAYVVQV
jgi:hypothetical protein